MAARQVKLPPVDVYRLLDDGIEQPLRYGLRRAFKHTGGEPSDEDAERIVEEQHRALMAWLCETFRFPDP